MLFLQLQAHLIGTSMLWGSRPSQLRCPNPFDVCGKCRKPCPPTPCPQNIKPGHSKRHSTMKRRSRPYLVPRHVALPEANQRLFLGPMDAELWYTWHTHKQHVRQAVSSNVRSQLVCSSLLFVRLVACRSIGQSDGGVSMMG